MPNIPNLARQVASFGVVGGVQIVLDWLCFVVLTALGVPPGPANVCGRVAGASMGFWLNGKWTFREAERTKLSPQALSRFVVLWCTTTAISTLVVLLVSQGHDLHWAWIVKPIADAILAAAGFAVSKFWIYR
jgi:putative flippase GtrA